MLYFTFVERNKENTNQNGKLFNKNIKKKLAKVI